MGSKLGDKYIAGFLDADGSIQIMWRPVDRADSNKELRRAYVALEFSQDSKQDKVLHMVQEAIGGGIYKSHDIYGVLKVTGKAAHMALSRIRKHLVVKRHYADTCLEMHGKVFNKREAQARLKEERKVKSLPLPNFPSRQWLAGYFDGDGCFQVRPRRDMVQVQIVAEISCSDYDSEGIQIIQKNFGGSINMMDNNRRHILKYCLAMPPSKAIKFIGYFSNHLITKRDQAMLILSQARIGHYREGKRIQAALKRLKAHPHRLNDPEVNVNDLLA